VAVMLLVLLTAVILSSILTTSLAVRVGARL
jgi:hypothetical protein